MRFETQASRTLSTSLAEILGQLAVPATWPKWQSEIVSTSGPDRIGVGDVVSGKASMLGFEVGGRSTALEVSDEAIEQDVVIGVRMHVRYLLTSTPEGMRITHRLTADLPSGFAGRILSFFLKRRLRSMQRDVLENLVTRLSSSGEPHGREVALREKPFSS
jgi:hypothetical protein